MEADGYHLYITNLPHEEFTPEEISVLYRARWEVELLFRELKSQYALDTFETGKEEIVRIQVLAALLTLVVSRAILRILCDRAATAEGDHIIPTERWAATSRRSFRLSNTETERTTRPVPDSLDPRSVGVLSTATFILL